MIADNERLALSAKVDKEDDDDETGFPGDPGDTSLEGDESFDTNLSAINNTETDELNNTPRDYYQIAFDAFMNPDLETDHSTYGFNKTIATNVNRTGAEIIISMFLLLRLFGDLRILDRAVELIQLTMSHRTMVGGHLIWDDRYWRSLDVGATGGLVAEIAWACRLNQDKTSPGGINYKAFADAEFDWLFNDFKPHWEEIQGTEGAVENDHQPFIGRREVHPMQGETRLIYFMGMENSQSAYFQTVTNLLTETVEEVAICHEGTLGGRAAKVYRLQWNETRPNKSSAHLAVTNYIQHQIYAYHSLMMENFDDRIASGTPFWTTWAAALADYTIDGDPQNEGTPWANSIGGMYLNGGPETIEDRCGIPWNDWRPRLAASALGRRGAYGMLAAYDSETTKIKDSTRDIWNGMSSANKNRYPSWPVSRVLDFHFHGADKF